MERIYKRYFESSCDKYTGNSNSEFVMDMNYVGSKALDFIKDTDIEKLLKEYNVI